MLKALFQDNGCTRWTYSKVYVGLDKVDI